MSRTYAAPVTNQARHARTRGEQGVSGTEAALALRIRADRPQEVDLAEVGPVGLAEVELALGALPQEEAAEALLPRRPDHQVRIGLALGVEVLGDVVDVDDLGELLETRAALGVLLEQRPDGIGDLAATAVRH